MSVYCTPLRRRGGIALKRKSSDSENEGSSSKEQRKILNDKECQLEKLELLSKHKKLHKDSELDNLIITWRNATAAILIDLYQKTNEPKPLLDEFLDSLRLDKTKLGKEVIDQLEEEIC